MWAENIFSLQGVLRTHYTAASYRRHRKRTNSEPLKRCFWLSLIIRRQLADCQEDVSVGGFAGGNKKRVFFFLFTVVILSQLIEKVD